MAISGLDPRLLRLTYASRAVEDLSREDLRDIARTAQRRNAALGVTGLLLYLDGDFLQVLEGPSAAVEQIYEAIAADPRNRWVTRLSTERVIRRAFEGWSMGCFELATGDLAGAEEFFLLDDARPQIRPRAGGDFAVFLDQFYARNRARGRVDDFARAL